MSALDVQVLAVGIGPINGNTVQAPALEGNGSFYDKIDLVSTLSSNNALSGSLVDGFFWFPTLADADVASCGVASAGVQDVSNNLNRKLSLVAFAPWVNATCQQAYFGVANANAPGRVLAFLTYLPDNSTDAPPPASDPRWDLGDGGQWRQNPYPVYAVNGQTGSMLMDLLNNYTQPIPDQPKGVQSWVLARVDTQSGSGFSVLPDLWTIVLAVLAAFIFVLAAMSGILHLLQRKRRKDLQRRILSGEVSLEAIGIRKLTVPPAMMEKMPVCKYANVAGQAATSSSVAPEKTATAKVSSNGNPAMVRHYNQPTCPICLDDFAPESDVRCLPCDHIFHPECCDSFLMENSSLCPMCKKSVLPKGYCPAKITNAMVRRERLARLRTREELADAHTQSSGPQDRGAAARMRGVFQGQSDRAQSPPAAVEMVTQHPTRNDLSTIPPLVTPAPPGEICTPSRREWARRRALQLLGNQHDSTAADPVVVEDSERQARVPRWRKLVAKVFPSSSV